MSQNEWPKVTLRELCQSQYGTSEGTAETGNARVVGMSQVNGGTISLTDLPSVELSDRELRQLRLHKSDVLFNRTNSAALVGKVGILQSEPSEPTVFASYLIRLIPNGRIRPTWLAHTLNAPVVVKSIRKLITLGVSQANINPTELLNRTKIPLPPLDEQDQLLEWLAHFDTAIARAADLISAKDQRLRGLMQQLLTGRRRLPAFADQPWEEVHIGDIAAETSERCGDRIDITVLSCTKSVGLVDSLEYFGRQVFGDDLSNYKVVRRDEFAYATNHIEEGSIGLLMHRDAGLVSPMYTVFRTRDAVAPSFLFRVLKTERYRQKFQAWTSASVNRRGGLRWGEFSQIKVPLPSLDEQRAIADVFDTAQREIDLLKQLRDQIHQQKRGLMQKLLTGQIAVPKEAHA